MGCELGRVGGPIPGQPEWVEGPASLGERGRFGPGLYVHIPFCRHRCGYCDFFTSLGGEDSFRAFMEDLHREVDRVGERNEFAGDPFRSIFLGGGTPSLLSGDDLTRLLDHLRATFRLASDIEVTLEANPESLSSDKLQAYRRAGLTRVSLGVQSLNPSELRLLERLHGIGEVTRCVAEARSAGFRTVSCDLIYGLPGGTSETWNATLDAVLSLSPDHLSAYLLTLEPHVPMGRRLREEPGFLPGEEEVRNQYEVLLARTAAAGYEAYEISNFARRGHECRHNQNYWVRGDYLGLGPSAHSHRGGQRWSNVASLAAYHEALQGEELPRESRETVTPESAVEEWIFLGLRRTEGIPWAVLEEALDQAGLERLVAATERLETGGWVETQNGRLRLPPRARFVSSRIIAELVTAL